MGPTATRQWHKVKDILMVVLVLLGFLAAVTDPWLLVYALFGIAVVGGFVEWSRRFR